MKYKCTICKSKSKESRIYAGRNLCPECHYEYKAIFEGWQSNKSKKSFNRNKQTKRIHGEGYWVVGENEWGANNTPFSFIPPEAFPLTMYDSDGKVVLCKCGKPAGSAAIGKECSVAWCSDCSPLSKFSAEFIYKPPLK
jgi:hypothetical protein